MNALLARRIGGLVLACALWTAGCGGGAGGNPGGEPQADHADPVQAVAQALEDPQRAEGGVWQMLELLGIGVYTPSGEQVLAGSEQSEDDFWLYDFEVPMLAAMAGGPAAPFDAYAEVVRRNGYEGTADQLRELYRTVYSAHPDHPLVRLLAATGVDFGTPPRLTPLQQWLLLLDTFVPPNGQAASRRGGRFAAQASCGGTIAGGNLASFWGLAGSEINLVLSGYQAYLAIHGAMLAQAATVRLDASAIEIHEGHGGPGDTVTFSLAVEADYVPDTTFDVGCGVLADVTWKPLRGGLWNALVTWDVRGVLHERATVMGQDAVTDPDGRARLQLQAVEEEAGGKGTSVEEVGEVAAWVDVRPALQAAGITSPKLLAFVPPSIYAGAVPVVVSWHEPCDAFVLRYEWSVVQDGGGYSSRVRVEGAVEVRIDLDDPGLPVSGQADLPLTGEGQYVAEDGTGCSWTIDGTDRVTVAGKVLPGTEHDPPTAALTVSHEQTGQVSSPEGCGAWLPLAFDEAITLTLRDGERLEDSWEGTTTSYAVELSCEPEL